MEINDNLSGVERQNQIRQHIQRHQRISVDEICSLFQVSEATARRDLESLANQGFVQRVHGGAISLQHAPPEQPMLQRQDEQSDEKRRIGRMAAGLVNDGDTIFLGSGTTILELARSLVHQKNLTVITNSLPVVNALCGVQGITLICLGGMLRTSEYSFIGHITEQALKEVMANKVFIGARAINLEQGLTNDYLPETMTDRAIINAGRQVIVVADHTKFERVSTALLAPISSIHMIITDEQVPKDFISTAEEQNIRIMIA
jgi:DeoR/GlpR family transcriptional regulator of sugar metabolism